MTSPNNSSVEIMPDEGGTFDGILRYVMKNSRMSETNARKAIMNVLKIGLSLGTIKRTTIGKYVLMGKRRPEVIHKIREPRFSDDSDDETSSGSSD